MCQHVDSVYAVLPRRAATWVVRHRSMTSYPVGTGCTCAVGHEAL